VNVKTLDKEMKCPISNKMTLSFKEYITEKYILDNNLNESPQNIGRRYPDLMDNLAYNKEDTLNTIVNGEYNNSFSLYGVLIDVYILNDTEYYFIDKKNNLTIAYVFVQNEKYTSITGLWKFKAYKTIMDEIFKIFIIPKFKNIISDISMSQQGIDFWKNFSIKYFDKFKIGYIINNQLQLINDTLELHNEKYWTDMKYQMYIGT
jgi:hypothetical protein